MRLCYDVHMMSIGPEITRAPRVYENKVVCNEFSVCLLFAAQY